MARIISLLVLLAVILFVAALFVRVMAGFILPMFLAAILVVIFRPLHEWMVAQFRGHHKLAAGFTTAAILFIVLVPLGITLTRCALDAYIVVLRFDRASIRPRMERLRQSLWLEIDPARLAGLRGIEGALGRLEGIADPSQSSSPVILEDARDEIAALRQAAQQLLEHEGIRYDPPIQDAVAAGEEDETAGEDAAEEIADSSELRLSSGYQFMQAIDRIAELTKNSDGADNGTRINKYQFSARLADAQRQYQQLKQELLGGVIWGWLKELANPTEEQIGRTIAILLQVFRDWAGPLALGTTQTLIGLTFGLIVLVLSLYFFLADGPAMLHTVMKLSPLREEYEWELLRQFDRASRAVVLAMILSSLTQGILAGIGFFFAGLDSVFLLMMLTMALALIPFVGAGAVWLPCSLWLFFVEGRMWAGGLLAVYGFFVVSMADNIVKPLVLHGQSSLHPLLALLSVLGGVQALGPIGVVVGPMVVVFLQALMNMFNTELKRLDGRRAGDEDLTSTKEPPLMKPPLAPKTAG
jgi:predicted PurR-regulated permease PerM